ncbi:unnamed protein product [Closterium sp. Naga37s-1]|nr:unnamed protein product [Closterium sp. Naga37s-1]
MAVLRVFLLVLSVLIAAAHVVSATAPIFESDPARDVGVLAADDLSSPVAVKDASILPLMQEIRRMLKGKAVKVKIGPSEMKAIAEVGKELAKYSKKEWDRMVKDKKKQAEKLEKGWEDTKKAANEVKQGFEKVGEGARKAADDVKQGFEKATNFFGNLGRNRAVGTLAVMQRAVAAHCWRAATCSALIGRPRPRPSTLAQLVQTLSERQAAQRLSHLRALISHASALPVDLRPEIKVSSEPAAVVMENADQTLRRAVARLASRLKADTAATTPPATQSPPPTAPPTASLLTAPSPARTATPLAVAKTVAPSGKAAATARGGIGTAGAASELKASGLKGSRSAKRKLAAGGEGKAVRVAGAGATAAATKGKRSPRALHTAALQGGSCMAVPACATTCPRGPTVTYEPAPASCIASPLLPACSSLPQPTDPSRMASRPLSPSLPAPPATSPAAAPLPAPLASPAACPPAPGGEAGAGVRVSGKRSRSVRKRRREGGEGSGGGGGEVRAGDSSDGDGDGDGCAGSAGSAGGPALSFPVLKKRRSDRPKAGAVSTAEPP